MLLVMSLFAVGADTVGDAGGEFAFGVVAVAGPGESPVVDNGDGFRVESETVEGFAEPVGALLRADGPERRGVVLRFGQEVSPKAEHVRPPPQVQIRVLLIPAEFPGGADH